MPEDLIIIGAGGTSREIAWAVEDINLSEPRWNLLGFLDDDESLRGQSRGGYPVLGTTAEAADYPGSRFIIGIASYRNQFARQAVVERLALPETRFATIVHPSAHVSRHARLEPGSAILHSAAVGHDTVVGRHGIVSSLVAISHGVALEEFVTIAAGAVISGSVILRRNVYVGAAAALRDGIEIGEGSLIGLGAVVTKSAAASTTLIGNPAKPLERR